MNDLPQVRIASGFTLGVAENGCAEFKLYDGEHEHVFATVELRRDDIDTLCSVLRSYKTPERGVQSPVGITEFEASRAHIERECGEPFAKLHKVGTRVRSACDDDPRLRPLLPPGDGTVLHVQMDDAGALITVAWDLTGATSVTRPHRLKEAPK